MQLTTEPARLCLIAHSEHEQDGATFQTFLMRRVDGSFRLDMVSDHPEHDDETFELTTPEAVDWLQHFDGREW